MVKAVYLVHGLLLNRAFARYKNMSLKEYVLMSFCLSFSVDGFSVDKFVVDKFVVDKLTSCLFCKL